MLKRVLDCEVFGVVEDGDVFLLAALFVGSGRSGPGWGGVLVVDTSVGLYTDQHKARGSS